MKRTASEAGRVTYSCERSGPLVSFFSSATYKWRPLDRSSSGIARVKSSVAESLAGQTHRSARTIRNWV